MNDIEGRRCVVDALVKQTLCTWHFDLYEFPATRSTIYELKVVSNWFVPWVCENPEWMNPQQNEDVTHNPFVIVMTMN